MSCLSAEQKQTVKSLYKFARKIVHLESHIKFLTRSLRIGFIPKSFKVKVSVPGNQRINQDRFDKVSIEAMDDEKQKHVNKLNWARAEFAKLKEDLFKQFDEEGANSEIKRVEKHIKKISNERLKCQERKLPKDATIVDLDVNGNEMDEEGPAESSVTPDSNKVKRRRRFKRRYLQPQPKRSRKRKSECTVEQALDEIVPEGWNGVIKNISGEPISKVEESLFLKGKKFSPVELDPPIVRMQKELNSFFRILRLQWHFQDQQDGRTELERKFYQKSDWNPPKACIEIENMIKRLQENFDKWKPPRFLKDNLSKKERDFLKDVKENRNIVYM